jgi:hypothetical protein
MMATVEQQKTTFTVNDAADRFARTTGRIRQICIEHEIGNLIENRIRLLSAADVRKIGRIIETEGYRKNSEKKVI